MVNGRFYNNLIYKSCGYFEVLPYRDIYIKYSIRYHGNYYDVVRLIDVVSVVPILGFAYNSDADIIGN